MMNKILGGISRARNNLKKVLQTKGSFEDERDI